MATVTSFSQVADDAERLSVDEQEALVGLLQRRLAESKRAQLVRQIEQGRAEYASGHVKPMLVDDLINEATE